MKIGICTFEQYHGRAYIGSSRIRGTWLANYWDEAERFVMGRKYDAIIFQKAYWVEYAKKFKGIKILDLCDPDFLYFNYKTIEMIEECDAVTTSTEVLKETIEKFTDKPVVFIPDRMDLNYHNEYKVHRREAETLVWFGYSTNFWLLETAISFLSRHKLKLIVISDKDFMMPMGFEESVPLVNYKWNIETVNRNIIKGDIVLNPSSKKGKWKYKSENKSITSYLLNMPVASTPERILELLDPKVRAKVADASKKWAIENYDVRLSVRDFKKLINQLKDGRV